MSSGPALADRYRNLSLLNALGSLIACAAAALVAGGMAGMIEETALRAAARETLNVQSETLTGTLDKYRLLPALLSDRPDVVALFATDSIQNTARARTIASRAAGRSGASDIAFLHLDGTVIATGIGISTNAVDLDAPLIAAARQGRLGRGVRPLANGHQAYVFTGGIRKDREVVGIVAVYVNLDELEWAWTLSANPILAIDQNDVILISNRDEWRQKSLSEVSYQQDGVMVFRGGGKEMPYLDVGSTLPLLGWRLCVLVDPTSIRLAGLLWGGLAAVVVLMLGIAIQLVVNKQHEAALRTRRERANAVRLERVVRERTRELQRTNASLANEIEEHRQAEQQLRQTQDELVQTSKLAALGQMSAALSHEYNQPLAAIKSYADNALTYIERKRTPEARENIKRISQLTDRMAEISKHLRNFARKPNPTFDSVPLGAVIDDALCVLKSRLDSQNARVQINGHTNVFVRAGRVRLQQVLINLVLNALDAMKDQREPMVCLEVKQTGTMVDISVRDRGTGIDPEVMETLFDPFITTKGVGKGLGLGLSISYNIIKDFNGTLKARNQPESGAEFIISLERGERVREAGE